MLYTLDEQAATASHVWAISTTADAAVQPELSRDTEQRDDRRPAESRPCKEVTDDRTKGRQTTAQRGERRPDKGVTDDRTNGVTDDRKKGATDNRTKE